MKILLNTESLIPPITGIGNYTHNILKEMVSMSYVEHVDCFNGYNWLTAEHQLEALAVNAESEAAVSPTVKLNYKGKIRKILRGLPLAYPLRAALLNQKFKNTARSKLGAIYHEPNYILKQLDVPSVVTVHDLSFLHYPQFHPRERVSWLTSQLPKTLKKTDFVITDSELVRSELMERYGIAEDRCKAIYLGADKRFSPREADQTKRLMTSLQLTHGHYILFVGTLEPRKGLESLLDAWLLLPRSLRDSFPLVIAGASGWRNSTLLSRIKKLAEKENIRHLDYVASDYLPVLYSAATVCVSPSIYEGFGLPVLEAMQSGLPTICKAGTSMDEFSAGACVLLETSEPEELAEKLLTLLNDDAYRLIMSKKGLSRAREFSWQRCAQETTGVYSLIS